MAEAPQVGNTTEKPRAAPSLGIWELAWPAILNNLLHALVGLVGIKIVGALGASAVAAVKIDHQIIAQLSTRRGPKRSPSQPPGIWASA